VPWFVAAGAAFIVVCRLQSAQSAAVRRADGGAARTVG
jgi:hypothetical protein